MATTTIKTCRYKGCTHPDAKIDTKTDAFIVDGKKYFHKDCYGKYQNDLSREEKISADMQFIKNMWLEHISRTVAIAHLFKILREYIDRGVDSDYLAFVMQYIVTNNLNLRYPQGFPYFVDRKEIKDAYVQSKKKKIPADAFKVVEKHDDKPKQQCAQPKRVNSFSDILGGR